MAAPFFSACIQNLIALLDQIKRRIWGVGEGSVLRDTVYFFYLSIFLHLLEPSFGWQGYEKECFWSSAF